VHHYRKLKKALADMMSVMQLASIDISHSVCQVWAATGIWPKLFQCSYV